jgi:hypothetical protein
VPLREHRRRLFDLEKACNGHGGVAHFAGKLAGMSGRLALILQLMDDAHSETVSKGIVERAAHLVSDFIEPHAWEFYRRADTAHGTDKIRKAASFILTSGKTRFVPADFTSNVATIRGLGVIETNRAISPLVAGNWLRPNDMPVATSWTVNPRVTVEMAKRREAQERQNAELARVMKSPRREKDAESEDKAA